MEPAQHGVHDVLNFSTEVHVFHRTEQTDRVVYWTVPHTSGKELWLEPWPDDRSDRTGACLSCPTSQAKADGQARINLGRANSDSDHSFSHLARLARTACTSDCADDLAALFIPIMDFSFGYFSKARILKLSEDLGHVGTRLVRSERSAAFAERPAALADRPAHVLILSALDTTSSDESGQEPNSLLDYSKQTPLSCWTGASHPATDRDCLSNGPPLVSSFIPPVLLSEFISPLPVIMFGLQRKNTKEKSPRPSASQSSFKSSLNYFDECVSVQEKPNRWSNEHVNTSKGESDPRRRLLQFDVQQFCDNFVKGVDKALKDVRKSQKKSTSTRAPVAEPSFSISKKTEGESENCFEEFKDFSDSSPIFDETDEEPIESLMSCEESCDRPYLESEFINDNEQANVELTVLQPEHPSSLVLSQQVFEEEPLDIPHQCPCLDTWISLDEVPEPIFDVEDEPDPVFDEEATSIISTFMESHLCFDSGTTTAPSSPAPFLPDLQEHCEKSELVISLPDMFDKISSLDVIRFGLDKKKENCFSKSVFGNMINSFKIFEPDKFLDQQRFQNNLGISSEIILSFDQSLEQSKVFDHFEKYLEFDMKQTDFCATKSFDSFVFKENSFDLNSSRHRLITDDSFASSLDLDDFLIKKMQEQNSLETETGFCELDFCDSVLQPDLLSFENDKTWNFLRSSCENFVDLSVADILVYNTFFEKCLELLINDSQTELKLVCSDVGKDMPILKMNIVVAYLDKICYLSCTFDPGLLVFFLSIQRRQVQPLNENIGRAQQPQIWRSFVVQTSYLGASDRGSVQDGYLNSPKVFCLESNFKRNKTHQGFTEAWNRMKSFTDEEVMNFSNRRFFSPSIREYQISKGDSCPRKNRPEPKPILHEPKVFPQSFYCLNQKHCMDHELIASTLHENVLKPRISKRKPILTWLKNVLLKPFHELISLSCALKEIWCRKKHEPKLLRPKNQFDFIHDKNFSDLALSLSFHNSFSPWPDFEIDKSIFGNQLTCLMLAHVLDDYPKGLDPDLDVLRIEKPFHYFFGRFAVVSLVALNKQDKHDHFLRRASTNGRQSTWNSLMKMTSKTDRVVYWTVPHTSGKELWLEPWPDDRSDRTGACLSCPTSQAKANGQARINLGRANSDSDHSFSHLARLARTACTSDCADDLAALFIPIMDFSFGYFSKARILKLSEDLGHVGTRLVRSERSAAFAERPAALADRPAHVLILSALDTTSSDESGQEPNSLLDYSKQTPLSCWTGASHPATDRDCLSNGPGSSDVLRVLTDVLRVLTDVLCVLTDVLCALTDTRTHTDSHGRPAFADGRPVCADGRPVCTDGHTDTHGQPQTPRGPKSPEQSTERADMCTDGQPDVLCVLTDGHGRPVCADGRPRTSSDVLCVLTDTHGRTLLSLLPPSTRTVRVRSVGLFGPTLSRAGLRSMAGLSPVNFPGTFPANFPVDRFAPNFKFSLLHGLGLVSSVFQLLF
ncbi:hypothetical protein IGI04_000484 [Brassica rapa subsp. trilocularis]|uniref:Uncharacterized protein n=1 Tax=Brassica rapa subsp. trilocularis TaxID=1813537 RepID=A0ABQ7NPW6_BRACM|nr:hypothetical protein IGI04_000484 [Brassica rapa subsp. trilocularis]